MHRVRSGLAAALAGMIMLSGCSQLGLGSQPGTPAPSGAPATPNVPAAVPRTFAGGAQWVADGVLPGSTEVTRYGVLGLFGNPEQRTVALLDSQTGKAIWVSTPFGGGEQPHLELVHQDGRDWAVVWYAHGDDAVTVRTYDIHGSGQADGKHEAYAEAFSGSRTPSVAVNSRGILISGVTDSEPFLLWPADGSRTTYGNGPTLDGDPGVPKAAYNNGFLVSFDPGFSFASATGGWPSTAATPAGGVPDSGEIVAVEHGLILATWQQTIGGTVLAVHSAQTGKVLAQQVVDDSQPLEEVAGSFVAADDGSWAAYGGYLFNLHGDELSTRLLDLHGGVPASIHDGVVYLSDVAEPFTAPDQQCSSAGPTSSATASPSGSPSPSASPTSAGPSASGRASATPSAPATPCAPAEPADFAGYAALDARSGVLVDQSMRTVPIGISAVAAGIFSTEAGENGAVQVFSVPLR
jgi:hypothetical protein